MWQSTNPMQLLLCKIHAENDESWALQPILVWDFYISHWARGAIVLLLIDIPWKPCCNKNLKVPRKKMISPRSPLLPALANTVKPWFYWYWVLYVSLAPCLVRTWRSDHFDKPPQRYCTLSSPPTPHQFISYSHIKRANILGNREITVHFWHDFLRTFEYHLHNLRIS